MEVRREFDWLSRCRILQGIGTVGISSIFRYLCDGKLMRTSASLDNHHDELLSRSRTAAGAFSTNLHCLHGTIYVHCATQIFYLNYVSALWEETQRRHTETQPKLLLCQKGTTKAGESVGKRGKIRCSNTSIYVHSCGLDKDPSRQE